MGGSESKLSFSEHHRVLQSTQRQYRQSLESVCKTSIIALEAAHKESVQAILVLCAMCIATFLIIWVVKSTLESVLEWRKNYFEWRTMLGLIQERYDFGQNLLDKEQMQYLWTKAVIEKEVGLKRSIEHYLHNLNLDGQRGQVLNLLEGFQKQQICGPRK